MADDGYGDYDDAYYADGFEGYQETTVDPGIWLLLGTTLFCIVTMLILMPLLVYYKVNKRSSTNSNQKDSDGDSDYKQFQDGNATTRPMDTAELSARNILRFDKETRSILKLALPLTVSSLASTVFATISFIIVSQNVTTIEITAYALVLVLVGLTDGILYGPISSCTTLCAQAVGASNAKLAGTYVQLAVLLYVGCSVIVFVFWWFFMYGAIVWLEWGSAETAMVGQEFIRHYMWTVMFNGVSTSLWQLLEIADHARAGTYMSILWGATNTLALCIVTRTVPQPTLVIIAWVYNATSLVFVLATYALAEMRGWLKPFREGLWRSLSLKNASAIKQMIRQAVPLSIGYFFSSADWAILTFMASHLGPAEVAAWAILGSIWDLFYYTTCGIADSGEIRVARHLGDNRPKQAQLAAYKALLIGMLIAIVTSIVVFFSLQNMVPSWFTHDETLIAMLRELVPFVGVANISMTFGMQCWSLIGAQGKYKVATWVSFVSSWGVTMPLAAIFVYIFFIDLQGLTAATTIGYTTCGAALSYLLLSTDWEKQARKVVERNTEVTSGNDAADEDAEEEQYASLQVRGAASKNVARRGIRLYVIPAKSRSGLLFGNVRSRPGTFVLGVREWSPFYGHVRPGDSLLSINGDREITNHAKAVVQTLDKNKSTDRELVIVSTTHQEDDEEKDGDILDAIEQASTFL